MNHRGISRRYFLYCGAVGAVAGLANDSRGGGTSAPSLRVLLHHPDGGPLDPVRVKTMIARDMANDTLPQEITASDGESRVVLASEPLQLACRLEVPGFGEVYCYASNREKGFHRPATIEFVVEAARTRLDRVRKMYDSQRHLVGRDAELEKRMEGAARTIPEGSSAARIAAAYESLSHGLHAGERLVLLAAKARMAKLHGPRRDFLFGAAASAGARSPQCAKLFEAAFNFATLSWYTWKQEEPVSARIDYGRMDESLQWALDHGMVPKGFGYVYLTKGATPEWLRSWPYQKLLPEYNRVVEQTMRRYAGRMPFAEIINEAHDKANIFKLSHTQILELTRESCQAARQGSAEVKRLINNCCLWAEYAKTRNSDGSRRWTPFRYLADCVKFNVEFERIGLQLYYPEQDLLEIERMLDRFKVFKRPIHISEIACNSAPGLDPASMRSQDLVPGWHGPWTETMQADWMEAIYTLCYSKLEFEAVGWWDVADYGGHFWPNGGLLHHDFTPKESYTRLLALQRSWGVARDANILDAKAKGLILDDRK